MINYKVFNTIFFSNHVLVAQTLGTLIFVKHRTINKIT